MFAFVITIHIVTCALLILIVLIQQGRGGGLIDSFSSAESIFGTKTSSFLVKSTTILAVFFFLTCLGLAFLSIQKSKSLVARSYKPAAAETSAPAAADAAQTVAADVTPSATAPAQTQSPRDAATQVPGAEGTASADESPASQ